jgi:magnesium transporter
MTSADVARPTSGINSGKLLKMDETTIDEIRWHHIRDPNSPELDQLGERYRLHPLHIEDCRTRNQSAKIEEGQDYLFTVLKPVELAKDRTLKIADLDLFLGHDYLITIMETECGIVRQVLDSVHAKAAGQRPDQLYHLIMDGIVDGYLPVIDHFNEDIDDIEDAVLTDPTPKLLQKIFEMKRSLIELRRILANMRDIAGHLQRTQSELIKQDLWPFLRDVYDHLARNLDMVEMQRDLLTGAMDIYLSSVANRTNQVMKVLTVMGTIALPSIVISGIYGMNIKGIPWLNSPYGMEIISGLMLGTTLVLLMVLKKFDWW